MEGVGRCKSGPEIAGAVEVGPAPSQLRGSTNARRQIISALHNRFPELFTPPFVQLFLANLKPSSSSASDRDIREKEDNARIIRQRALLRTLGELEVVGTVRKAGGKGAVGDVSWGVLRELVRSCCCLSVDLVLMPTVRVAHSGQGSPRTRCSSRDRIRQTPRAPLPPSSLARRRHEHARLPYARPGQRGRARERHRHSRNQGQVSEAAARVPRRAGTKGGARSCRACAAGGVEGAN